MAGKLDHKGKTLNYIIFAFFPQFRKKKQKAM